jgi:hypothetical protein
VQEREKQALWPEPGLVLVLALVLGPVQVLVLVLE